METNASAAPYEFLDLTDIDDSERKQLICTLYKSSEGQQQHKQQKNKHHDQQRQNQQLLNDSFASSTTTTTTHTNNQKSKKSTSCSTHGTTSATTTTTKDFNKYTRYETSKYVNKNVAAINLPQHITANNDKTSPPSAHVVRNVVFPRLLAPITLPICAVVKPTFAEVAVVPLPSISAAGTAANSLEQQPKSKVNYKLTSSQNTTMAQHNTSLHHSQQQQQQQLVGASVQLQPQPQSVQSAASLQNNNLSNYSGNQQHAHNFNQIHPSGVFMPPHGHGPAMYQMMPASLPGNVYVNNVTANVNLHGYSMSQYMPPFIPGEVQQGVPHGVEPGTQMIQQAPPTTSTRGSRRGRGRGGNNNSRRNDYMQRQQASPAPQEMMNPAMDPQGMGPAGYQQYYQYYPQPFFSAPPQGMGHPQAQQATGTPLYLTGPVPMYATGPQMYNYPGIVYNMMPPEYQMMDDKVEDQPAPEGMMTQMWHPHMHGGIEYADEYLSPELVDDINNHNASPMSSSNTPSIMSPILYEPPMDIQQMNALHLYDTPSLSQQSLQSDEQISDGNGHHHHQMHPMMHEQMIVPGQIPVEEMQMIDEQQHLHHHHQQQQQVNINSKMTDHPNALNMNEPLPTDVPPHSIVVDVSVAPPPIHHVDHNVHHNMPSFVNNNTTVEQIVNTNVVPATAANNNLVIDQNQNVPKVLLRPEDESVVVVNTPVVQQLPQVHPIEIHQEIAAPSVENSVGGELNMSKTLSWTNQVKKNTTSVAVTATPVSTGKILHPTAPNHKNAPTLNVIAMPATQTVQVKNHGAMKTPSSPIATNEPIVEKKSAETVKNVSTTSIASTVVPQQFQQEHKVPLQTQLSVESKKQQQQQQDSSAAYATAGRSSVEGFMKPRKDDGPTIILPTPAPQTQAPPSQSGGSWASLFTGKAQSPGGSVSSAIPPQIGQMISHPKKPVAKVLPFEGTSNIAPALTPGTLSYSAASAQGLSTNEQTIHNSNSKPKSSATHHHNNNTITAYTKGNIDDWSLKFADFLTKYKIDFAPVSLRPRGLTNRSNYCYINAILQALVGCPPFYNLIKSIPKQPAAMFTEKTTMPTINAMIQLVSEFSHLPPGARLMSNRREKGQKGKDDLSAELTCDPAFEPTAIYKLWNASRSDIVEGRQEDAEEFLGYVLNQLNDEMLEAIKLIAKPSVEQNGDQNTEGDDGDDWQMIYNNRNKGSVTRQQDFGRTPLSDIFRGELRSRLQREGELSTDDIQPFFTLQLNIEKAASVKEALEILVGRDQLEGVTCSKTNQEVIAWQQMTLEKLPVVLVLHLKWFDYKTDGCTKILKTVEFPVELKIDTKILASKKYSQKQRLYRLFAVVYHDGKEASKGHYITDVFHVGYNNWLRYDDSSVKPVSEHSVLRPRAPRVPYLLYYRRCDTVTPSQQQQQQQQHHQQQQQQQQQQNTTSK